ncbi:MAG: 2-phospho-L-lactate transferase CofD family protein, partial [Actinomycetota bacterium]
RIWQVYWAHISVFMVSLVLMIMIDWQIGGDDYIRGLLMQHFFNENAQAALVGLLTLTFVPPYFDILPMYLVILVMVPIVMALAQAGRVYAGIFILGLWFISQFNLTLGTHLFRTGELRRGRALHDVTADIARAWDLTFGILPVTNDRLRTMVTTVDEGELTFQEYFVGRAHSIPVSSVRFEGAEASRPAPGVIEAIEQAERVIIAPSNPVVSIDPVLAVPGVTESLRRRRDSVVAVSPIIAGKALKGPADRLLVELGREASVLGVAEWYRGLIGTLVVDQADADSCPAIEDLGVAALATDTIMADPAVTAALARTLLTVELPGAATPR